MPDTGNTDVATATQTINPDSNNPESLTQTSTLFTEDNDGAARDEFCLSVNVTGEEIPEVLNIVVVIDTSGSSGGSSGTDFNGDGVDETILEAELIAAETLFDEYVAAGYNPEEITISLVSYAASAEDRGTFRLDGEPDPVTGLTPFETALADIEADGSSGTTNYVGALEQAGSVLDDITTGSPGELDYPQNLVVFLSDGFPVPSSQASGNPSPIEQAAQDLVDDYGSAINGIGIGANSSLNALNQLDNTGGATQVLSGQDLVDIIVEPLSDADLIEFQILVEGFDENGVAIQELITIPAGDPRIITTPTGWDINELPLSQDLDPGTEVTITVTTVFEPDPDANPSPGPDQTITTQHQLTVVVCFTPGTFVLTPNGAIKIDNLEAGDRVITRDRGVQAIRWIGATTMPGAYAAANKRLRPVLIRKDALGPNQPERDMRVSRQHRVLVRDWRADVMFGEPDGVLVPAFALCNDSTIIEERPKEDVTYIHMVFDNHEVIYADGIETESFHPAARTVAGLKSAQRQELLELFPELADGEKFAYDAARGELRGRAAMILAD